MAEDTQLKVASLIENIKKAENDSQKFAALLVVSKMVEANKLSEKQRKELFLAIGITFPHRLLITSNNSDSKSILQALGLSLLASFASVDDLVKSPELQKSIPVVLKIMCHIASSGKERISLTECFQYLAAMATINCGCYAMLKHSGVKHLVNAFCSTKTDDLEDMFWSILLNLIRFDEDAVWKGCLEEMLQLLSYLSESACHDHSSKKFVYFKQINVLLKSLPSYYAETYFKKGWLDNLAKSLFDVLRSKSGPSQRNPALKLSHMLTSIFHFKWTLCETGQSVDRNFAVLLIKLSCVEIKLIIYKWSNHDANALINEHNSEEMSLLLSCFSIFEATCVAIADFDSSEESCEVFSFKDIEALQPNLSETANAIVDSLLAPLNGVDGADDILLCCLRAVGSWLNVEHHASSKVGLTVARVVLSTFKHCLKVEPADAIKSTAPAIMHYTEHDTVRNQILDAGIVSSLYASLVNADLCTESRTLSAQCLMALCLQSEGLVSFSDNFLPLLDCALKCDKSDIVSWFYISTLALLIWNRVDPSCLDHQHTDRFFRSLLNVLHQLHTTDGTSVCVTKRYSQLWEEIEQLWSIVIKELIRAARSNTRVKSCLLDSRLPVKVETILASSKGSDSETVECYGLLDAFIRTTRES